MLDERTRTGLSRIFRKEWFTPAILLKASIGILLTVTLVLLFPRGASVELEYKVGAVWAQKDLIAPFSFPVFRDEHEYARDVNEARKTVFDVFERDTAGTDSQLAQLDRFFSRLEEALAVRAQIHKNGGKHSAGSAADSLQFFRLASALDIPFSDREWDALSALAASGRLREMRRMLGGLTREYLKAGILDRAKSSLGRSDLALRKGSVEEIIPSTRLLDNTDLHALLEKALLDRFAGDPDAVGIAYKIGVMQIRPNIRYSTTATDQGLAAAADAVPRTLGFVQENERVVSKHERITQETRLKLESLRRERQERGAETDRPSQMIGTLVHVSIILLLYGLYLYLFRTRIFGSNRKLALIAILFLIEGVFAYLTREADVNAPVEYLIFVPVASMLLTIVFDSRVGFYGTVTIAFLVAGIRGNDYSIALASLVAGSMAVYTVRDMKNRTQIFRSLGFIFLGYALSITALGLERYEATPIVVEQLAYGLLNAVISPVLTYGLLIFVEKTFRVTTDLALMELAHFNHPLLRQLAEQAPGTYHHSLTIATLAEAAAAAVGANEVLARVGAYFHDIGKIVKPTYFVENQKGSRNRHDKLAPRMSSLIIAAHVKDGIALAQEHHLPEEVIEFIPMHHGTTRMDYFYNKALELAQNDPDETKIDEIKEQDYCYPGPRPQSKETGILMLADAIEAAVRTIEDPTPQRVEQTIEELIKKRFEEGELDECPLTLKDLTRIKAAFLGVLVGIYHTRVKYPDTTKKKTRRPGAPPSEPPGERLTTIIKEIDGQ
jgi:putative nucleotidyltransferase with HDIG domain